MTIRVGVVLIGRSNSERRSNTFPKIFRCLEGQGFPVFSFKSDRSKYSEKINLRLMKISPEIAASVGGSYPLHRRAVRFCIKGALVVAGKQRWSFIKAAFQAPSVTAAKELERFIDTLPLDHVHLIGHSAGGIAATKISKNPKVKSVSCFGYPFKHPQRPAEDYRTQHLSSVSKPFLIIQGSSDEYGAADDYSDAVLPRECKIVTLDCDHDYSDLSEFDFDRAWMALSHHIAA
jgi:predicted alpha/beta-hydrolase family hydrolase